MLLGTLLRVVGEESKHFVEDLDDNDLLGRMAWYLLFHGSGA